jgi:ParE toxin of type II toxin-antitoxin system, parDE
MSNSAGETGLRWFAAMQEALVSLASFPNIYPIAPESASFPFEVRQLFYGRKPHVYRILFTVEGETVYVLHLRHGRRLPLTS